MNETTGEESRERKRENDLRQDHRESIYNGRRNVKNRKS